MGKTYAPRERQQVVAFAQHPYLLDLMYPARIFESEMIYEEIPTPASLVNSKIFQAHMQSDKPATGLKSNTGLVLFIYPKVELGLFSYFQLIFSIHHFEQGIITYKQITEVLRAGVEAFGVEEGRVVVTGHNRIGLGVRIPTQYHKADDSHGLAPSWVTFYGNRILQFIGEDRFAGLKHYHEMLRLPEGMLFSLQEELFDPSNPEHPQRVERAIQELKLYEFEKPKR